MGATARASARRVPEVSGSASCDPPAGNGGGSIDTGPATITVNGGALTGGGPTGARYAGASLKLKAGSWSNTASSVTWSKLASRKGKLTVTLAFTK